ncbi:Hpt domain-containing protein [Pseudoxanthomonas sp. CF125]|uniref:Hpt domain-containing protein n=1 Tax=Pseudoxanthomonas sp. CF125 TaxID=1855303 RepID=UPI00087FCB8B|nr:Hpt domain-containing protein [Pseudoxanthomonas sp. CF125]SDQ94172.1 chemosensory pili system protein ChpA (sensor histidine kinase/response regulator) [Pseudoxanthomonas sp. CF125]
MSALRDAMSHAVLGWVKPELDETLRLARSEVEFFAEDPADTSRMHFCAGYLHQVQGTLRMVELYAPAMVAEELELLARALQEKTTVDQDEACGTLMRGTVLLPDYLERLQGGHRDIPIVLLPLLNDIRAARGAPGLSESVLFAPDLEQPLPQELPLPEVLSWQARQTRVGQAQEQLEQALSAWPEDGVPADAAALSKAVSRLLESVEHIATRRMLWVASAVSEALRDGALAATPALRQAYTGVSRAVRASQEGAASSTPSSQEPTRQLLYLIAQSPARHAALDQLREAFALDAELPSEEELDHARGSVSGRNRALLDTVAGAVKEELLRIKDALDLHLRTGAEVGALQTQVSELGNVADTLGMVGLGVARGVVVQQRDALREMVDGQRVADEGALLDIAGALLYVDASLDDQVSRLGEAAVGTADTSSSESQRTVEVLAQEAMRNFSAAREGFVAFIETNWSHAELEQVPRLLSEVAGALRMLELPEPADYLLGVRQYVAVELIGKRRVPGGQQLDTLADAMASLEYYLEALRERRPNRDEILDITRSSLEKLRYWPVPAEAPIAQETVVLAETETPAVIMEEAESASFDAPLESAAEAVEFDRSAVDAAANDEEGVDALALDTAALEALEVEEALQALELEAASLAEAEEEQTLEIETTPVQAEADLAAPTASVAVHNEPAMGGFETAASDIDDDIREVFLEEFDEEIVNLKQMLPAWSAAPGDMERLRSIRRVFHTLKGSGRLVGAKLLGEFSWKIENMLNRVLDGTRAPSAAVIALLEHSTQVLPQLNAALRGQGRVSADLIGLQDLSDRVAAGEEAFYKAPVATTDTVAVEQEPESEAPAQFEPETEGTPASVDGVLREILETEVGAHLETVDGWLARAHAAPAHADESLLRAFHTMNGAFAMADVPEITEVTGAAEQYVKRLSSARETASAEGVAALADSAYAIRRSIAALQASSPRIPVFAALAAQLTGLRDSLPEVRSSAVIVDDSSQGTYTEAMPSIAPPVSPNEVELSVHDLSAYLGHEVETTAPATSDGSTLEISEELTFDDQPIVLETEEASPGQQAVTFYDVELTYVREPVERPLVSATEGSETTERAGQALPEFEEAAGSAQEEEPVLEESATTEEFGATEDIAVEELAAEELAVEEPGVEEPVTEEPSIVEETALDEPALVLEEPILEEPAVVEEIAVEESVLEEPAIDEVEFEAPVEAVQAEETSNGTVEAEAIQADSAQSDVEAIEVAETIIDTVEPPSDVVPEQPAVETGVQEMVDTVTAGPDEPVEAGDTLPAEDLAEELETAAPSVAAALAATPAAPDDALDFTELDRDLVDIFVEEGNDLLDHSDGLLAKLRETPEDRSLVTGLQRDLHTIKGGARMAGINAIGDLGHAIESLLEQVAAQRIDLDGDSVRLLERGFDGLHGLVTKVGAHRKAPMPTDLIAEFEQRARPQAAVAADASDEGGIPAPAVVLAPLSAPIDTAFAGDDEAMPYAAQEQVRVRADLLDRLVNHAGEVAIYRSRLEQQLGAFRGAMSELDRTNIRLHDQLRRLDLETEAQIVARYQREQDKRDPTFDPLELDRFSTLQQLSRGLAESAADITGLQGVLDDLARQYDTLLQQQSRVSSELQDGLMRARMVPFDGLVPRLRRVLRQAATDTGKQVKLHLDGAHGELDRNVLERMTAPLEHLLRNAVAHGLESPKQRRKKNKPEEGTVQIALRREGAEMVFQVSDDGAGIDHAAIRRRAEQRGMVQSDAQLTDSDLERLILESGFSTSESISQLAGRGVGMDVVYSEVRQLGGSLEIASESDKGTTFTLRLPQTLAVTQAVFVQIGETQFAVPVAAVGGVGRISRDRFETAGAVYVYGGEEYVLHDLGALIGQPPARAEGQPQVPLLLVHAGDLRAAVAVDQVLGNREIVVKPVGPQIASVPGIYGATITGDGRIVVILDVAPLVRRHILQPNLFVSDTPAPEERRVPLVMVVDDSLTMRKVTGRVLERHNFEVAVARDGVEALERLEERVPDLMLLDIEMPRMDGYELATAMKADPRFKDVPIVMITSRTGDKHRQRAMEIGVQRYMGKPYQELDLMRNVYDLLGIARVRE